MMTIYKTRLDIKIKSDEFYSRLIWKTKLVTSIIFAKTSSFESDTIRPFVGELDEKNGILKISRIRPLLLNFYVPQIIVQIENKSTESKNYVFLRFKLGIYTTIVFVIFSMLLLTPLINLIKEPHLESMINYLTAILLISVIIYGIIFFEVNTTMKKIEEFNYK
jgi:hypothetical protein